MTLGKQPKGCSRRVDRPCEARICVSPYCAEASLMTIAEMRAAAQSDRDDALRAFHGIKK